MEGHQPLFVFCGIPVILYVFFLRQSGQNKIFLTIGTLVRFMIFPLVIFQVLSVTFENPRYVETTP